MGHRAALGIVAVAAVALLASACSSSSGTSASGGKPVWMTLQIAWSGVAASKDAPDQVPCFPSLKQERFMAYQAIVNGARGLVFDPGRNLLYITTAAGTVERYDVTRQALLAPFQVGTSLYGADLSADGQFLYVTDASWGLTQGFLRRVNLDQGDALAEAPPEDLLALDEALERLTRHDPRGAQLVKLHCFAGLTVEQASEALGLSRTEGYRLWTFVRAWLHSQLAGGQET